MFQRVARITTKGQVTIPAEIRRLLGVRPHDQVTFLVEQGHVHLSPAKGVVARTAGMLQGPEPRLSPQEEKRAAEEGIAEEGEKRPQ